MKTRLITAGVASAIVITLLVFKSTLAMPIALALICAIGVFEIIRATRMLYNIPMLVVSLLLSISIPFVEYFKLPIPLIMIYYGYFLLFAASILVKFETDKLAGCFISFVMICSLTFGLNCAHKMFSWEFGMFYFLLAAFTAFVSDAGAYFVGSTVGRTHFAPNVSPNKTVEGSIGGLACSIIVNIIFAFIYSYMFANGAKINFAVLIITVLIASAAGMIGDLFASAVKRLFGVKDYGRIMPGHGGIMDRCDSIILTLSVVYVINSTFVVF